MDNTLIGEYWYSEMTSCCYILHLSTAAEDWITAHCIWFCDPVRKDWKDRILGTRANIEREIRA
jgi:hypothetical protein